MEKIISFIGFAKKANKIVIGQSSLKRYNKQIYLIMVCSTASGNLKDLAKNLANKHNCEYIETKISLEELSKLSGIKILGITDENLAKGIILNKESISIG